MSSRARARLGPVQALLIGLIHVYRDTLGLLLGGHCRFYPSCSQYAITALNRYGLVKGIGLAAKRLLRCHPWNAGGIDPVP